MNTIFHSQYAMFVYDPITNCEIQLHCSEVTTSTMAFQITGVSMVYLAVCSGANQGKYQSSVSLAFVGLIHR